MTWCLPQRFPPWTILNALCHAEPPGSTIAGDFTGTQPGHGCPTEPTFPGCSRKIHQQFSWSSASPQSRVMAAAINPKLRLEKSQLGWFGFKPPCAHIWVLQWAQEPAQGSPHRNPAPGIGTTLLGLPWQYLQFCHVLKPHKTPVSNCAVLPVLLSVLLGSQISTEAHCNSVCQGLNFYPSLQNFPSW